ncbi:MAG: metallophosphoesterase, partial [Myxococcaceae bacterium]
PPDRYRIVVLHTPDDVEHAAERKPDLYLAGHTHGGQVRIPLYGAVITESAFDKKYEMGEYRVQETTLFVSRGVGVEPGMPRIRFDCRPEIAVIDLIGE